jgi:Domain of unknown function (DUF4211)
MTSVHASSEKKLRMKVSESSGEQTGEDDAHVAPSQDSQQEDSDGDDRGDDNDDMDDFVVQDDGSVIPDLPAAFSRHSHQDTRHDFKVVCQLFVHIAMMPMDERRTYMEKMLKGTSLYIHKAVDYLSHT